MPHGANRSAEQGEFKSTTPSEVVVNPGWRPQGAHRGSPMSTSARVITSGSAQKHGHAVPDSTAPRFTRAGCAAPSSTRVSTAQPTSSVGQSPLKQLEDERDAARGLALGLFDRLKDALAPEVVEQLRREFATWSAR